MRDFFHLRLSVSGSEAGPSVWAGVFGQTGSIGGEVIEVETEASNASNLWGIRVSFGSDGVNWLQRSDLVQDSVLLWRQCAESTTRNRSQCSLRVGASRLIILSPLRPLIRLRVSRE